MTKSTTTKLSSRPLLARSNMAASATATTPTTTSPTLSSSSSNHNNHNNNQQAGPGPQIPSIRLVTAPAGASADSSISFHKSLEVSWEMVSQPSALAPKTELGDQPRKKLVPKKSKLSILGMGVGGGGGGGREKEKHKERVKDSSDVVHRKCAPPPSSSEGLLAPPGPKLPEDKGSIALRAIRSMRSLARIGSWAQLKSSSSSSSSARPTAQQLAEEMGMEMEPGEGKKKDKDGTIKKKKKKIKKSKKKEEEQEQEQEERGGTGTVKRKSDKKDKLKDKTNTMRISTSSFEIGHLSASPVAPKTLGTKKHSILGLGLPSTMRLPRMRGGSTASSLNFVGQANPGAPPAAVAVNAPPDSNRLSVESAGLLGRDRAASAVSSNGSSLRPVSVASSHVSSNVRLSSGASSVLSSGASVRWDEDGLEAVRERRRKERDERRSSSDDPPRTSKEGRRSLGAQRRTPLSAIFPEVHHHQIGTALLQDVTEEDSKLSELLHQAPEDGASSSESDGLSTRSATTSASSSVMMRRRTCGAYPILTIEEATADGHGSSVEEGHGTATPVKRRIRPLSEQLLGRSRPRAMHEDEDGVHSILTRATDDLALLLDTLHLEASPGTPDVSPIQVRNQKQATLRERASAESPVKKTLRSQASSIRPYAQSRGYNKSSNDALSSSTTDVAASSNNANAALIIGQPISPWPVLLAAVSPEKKKVAATTTITPQKATPPSTFKLGHKRSMTPAPEPEPEPVLQPLKPALRSSKVAQPTTIRADCRTSMTVDDDDLSSQTGSSLTPLFKQVLRNLEPDALKRESLCPADYRGKRPHVVSLDSRSSRELGEHSYLESFSLPIGRDVRKALRMSGTLGGSDVSGYEEELPLPDASDPDSDVPDELRFILATHSDRESIAESLSFQEGDHHASRAVPSVPLDVSFAGPSSSFSLDESPHRHHPVFRAALFDEDQNRFELDGDNNLNSDEETKKSFDFTGELRKLNESGASDRASFVEQLEIAFKTPAKVDLRCDFGTQLQAPPPVPPLPSSLLLLSSDQQQEEEEEEEVDADSTRLTASDLDLASRLVDVKEPTFSDGFTQSYLSDGDGEVGLSVVELASSTSSRPSTGELDRSFKFGGGRPREVLASQDKSEPLNLSDIIPPLDYARILSEASLLDNLDDDSVLRSIYAKLQVKGIDGGDVSSATDLGEVRFDRMVSRPASGVSFAGLDSFDEVRRGFEFSGDRSFYPPPSAATRRVPHRREESVFSIASVSSYGRVLNNGVSDPFDYGLPSLQERPSFEDLSMSIDDTFAFVRNRPRRRVESDASSFYFRDSGPAARGHRRRESSVSVASHGGPPISLYNRSFGHHHHHHRRNESSATSSSVALSYAKYGANSGISAWAAARQQQQQYHRHRRDVSMDSIASDFSSMHLGRPGIGDKMFEHNTVDLGPLTSISASPPEKEQEQGQEQEQENSDLSRFDRTSGLYDSILDGEPRGSRGEYDDEYDDDDDDSLFDRTGVIVRAWVSSESLFENDRLLTRLKKNPSDHDDDDDGGELGELIPPAHPGPPPPLIRPDSSLSVNNTSHSFMEDGDTMISMFDGGHVRRRSMGGVDASPCVRIEKRKHLEARRRKKKVEPMNMNNNNNNKNNHVEAVIVEKPSISSTASIEFGGHRMIKARQGLLERQSLEDGCFVAEGEDVSGYRLPVFTRPLPARSRSSTCTSSSGGDTPPLSCSDGSLSEGSQSSIDLGQIDVALANATHPLPTTMATNVNANANVNVPRSRVRARGNGHRRRYSKAHVSRSSVYETIEEEAVVSPAKSVLSSSRVGGGAGGHDDDATGRQPVYVMDAADAVSIGSKLEEDLSASASVSVWDDERGIVALRKFYALRDEATNTVTESRRIWLDTPFSIYALQSFHPPEHPAGMRALLEHSVQSYGPLPSELRTRRVRSRTSSRPSPYPQNRISKQTLSVEHHQQFERRESPAAAPTAAATPVLRTLPFDANLPSANAPTLGPLKPFSPLTVDDAGELSKRDKASTMTTTTTTNNNNNIATTLPLQIRPRVASSARRTAFGWSKRSGGGKSSSSSEQQHQQRKENVVGKENVCGVGMITTPGNTLRLNRPRPKGRTPGGGAGGGGRTAANSQNRLLRI